MEIKKHYKMFKNGKQWAYAAIATVAVAFGTLALTAQPGQAATVNASASNVTTSQTYQATQTSGANQATTTPAANQVSTNQTANQATNPNNVQGAGAPANYDQGNYGYIDNVSVANSTLHVSGWNISNQDVNKPYHYVIVYDQSKGAELARQAVTNTTRADVAAAYPNVTNAANSGFSADFKIDNLSYLSDELQIISRYSDNANGEGNNVDFWYGPVSFNQSRGKKQGALTTIKSNGSQITVNGYDMDADSFGKPYHYLILFDRTSNQQLDFVKVANQRTNGPVDDTIYNSANAGFTGSLSYQAANAGDQLSIVSRYSDSAEGNGAGGHTSDMWYNFSTNNYSYLDSFNVSDGTVAVSGWNANDRSAFAPYHFLILFDNTSKQQVAQTMVTNTTRQDVKAAHNELLTGDQSGFNANFGKVDLVAGHSYSLVSRYSTANTGNGGQGTYSDNWMDLGDFNQSAYSLDSQTQSGNQLNLAGWMASDSATTKPYAYAIVLENGQEVGRAKLNLTARPDVAKAYPSLYNSGRSGFSTSINVGHRLNGIVKVILRFTDDASGNGNYTDQAEEVYYNNGQQQTGLITVNGHQYYFNPTKVTNATFTVNGEQYSADANGVLSNKAAQAVNRALSMRGVPYVYGGNTPAGFDCSGLVQWVFGLGANYRTTYQQCHLGAHHYDVTNAPKGALVLFGSDSAPYHVGISLGNGTYVHAPQPGQTVTVQSMRAYKPSYYLVLN